jgi:hypothetical protein
MSLTPVLLPLDSTGHICVRRYGRLCVHYTAMQPLSVTVTFCSIGTQQLFCVLPYHCHLIKVNLGPLRKVHKCMGTHFCERLHPRGEHGRKARTGPPRSLAAMSVHINVHTAMAQYSSRAASAGMTKSTVWRESCDRAMAASQSIARRHTDGSAWLVVSVSTCAGQMEYSGAHLLILCTHHPKYAFLVRRTPSLCVPDGSVA